jgi:methyl-accepting chemotaxis protein
VAEERDVRAKLKIEREGDPRVFDETSSGLEELSESIVRVTEAQKRLADAKGPEETLEALKELQDALEDFGDKGKEGFEQNEKAAAELAKALEETKRRIKELADPLGTAFDAAASSIEKFDDAASKGLRSAERMAAQARVELERYEQQLRETEAAGGKVGVEERENLARLEGQLDSATKKWAQYKNAQDDAKDAIKAAQSETEAVGGSINDLGDIVQRMGPKWSDLLGRVTAVVGAFTAGYAAGNQLRDMLNQLTSGGFDRTIQSGIEWAARLVDITGKMEEAAEQTEYLTNVQNILRNKGLDPATMSVEQQIAAVERLGDKNREAAAAAQEHAQRTEEVAKAFDKIAVSLDPAIAAQRQYEEQAATVREALELGIIDHERYVEVLVELADKRDRATSKDREAVSVLGQLRQAVATLTEETAGVDSYGQAWDEARAKVAQVVQEHRAAGQQIPMALAQMAEKYGVLVGAMEIAEAGSVSISKEAAKAGEALRGAGAGAEAGARGVKEQAEAAKEAAAGVGELGAAQERAATSSQQSTSAAESQAAALQQQVGTMQTYASTVEQIGAALERLGQVEFAARIVTQMDQIIAKADATLAKLQEVASFGAGGGAGGGGDAAPAGGG